MIPENLAMEGFVTEYFFTRSQIYLLMIMQMIKMGQVDFCNVYVWLFPHLQVVSSFDNCNEDSITAHHLTWFDVITGVCAVQSILL